MKKLHKRILCLVLLAVVCLAFAACDLIGGKSAPKTVWYDWNYQGSERTSQIVTGSQKLNPPTPVDRQGYLFDGWFLDRAGTEPLDVSTAIPVNGGIYFAKWTALPTSLSATYVGAPLVEGDSVKFSDVIVTVTYADGTEREVKNFFVDEGWKLSLGQNQMPISFIEKGTTVNCTLPLTVAPAVTVSAISATYTGAELTEGDEIDLSKVIVTATYSDNTVKVVTNFTVNESWHLSVGQNQMPISYSEKGKTVNCTLSLTVAPALKNLSATYSGTEKIFVGGNYDKTKIAVTAIYTDDTQKSVSVEDCALTGWDSSSAGVKEVTVSFSEKGTTKTCIVEISVVEAQIATISAAATEEKIYVGDQFSKSFLTVTATYEDNTQKVIINYTQTGWDSSSAGEKQFSVSADGVTATATVTVNEVLPVGISAAYVGQPVPLGLTIDSADFEVSATYNNGSIKNVTTYSVGSFTADKIGEKTVEISYSEKGVTKTVEVTVGVTDAILMSVRAEAEETDIFVGDVFSAYMIEVTATLSDGTEEEVMVFDYVVTGFDSSVAGANVITVSYFGKTGQVTLNIQAVVIVGISATHDGTVFTEGDRFRPTTLTVLALYSNGTSRKISSAGSDKYTHTTFSCASAGTKEATVYYGEFQATFTYLVVDAPFKEIEVEYVGGTLYDDTTLTNETLRELLVVKTVYANNQKETKYPTEDYSVSGFTGQVGTNAVTVSCEVNNTTYTKTVNIPVVMRTLVSLQARYLTSVLVGEQPVDHGFEVTAGFDNGSFEIVSNFGFGTLASTTAGTKSLEVSYTWNGQTASCQVQITVVGSASALSDNVSIHFLELGNASTGDCVYIKAGDVDILIDAGSKNNSAPRLISYIDKYVTDGKLEYVIATHAHEDHIGAFYSTRDYEGIFEHYDTDLIIDFATTNKSNPTPTSVLGRYYDALQGEINNGATHYTAAQCFNQTDGAKRVYQITDDVSLEILYNYYYFNKPTSGENDASVCVMLRQGANNYLFTGDLESGAEKKMVNYYVENGNPLPHCVLYKAGHHGSKTSTSNELMLAVSPEYCCICTCCGSSEYTNKNVNQFPTQEFVDRISPYTDRVYLTSLVENYSSGVSESMNGDIIFRCVNGVITLECTNNNLKLRETDWYKNNRHSTYWDGDTCTSRYHD